MTGWAELKTVNMRFHEKAVLKEREWCIDGRCRGVRLMQNDGMNLGTLSIEFNTLYRVQY